MKINDILVEFASGDSGDSGNYFQALASAWYNGTFDSGSLQKGIKSQQDVERLLNRGIVCPDGKTRKLHIDYNADFDGVEIYSDDYYEYGDHDDTIDSRTGQKWGPYDFMAFSDEDLSEGINEFVTPQAVAQDPGLEREKDVDVVVWGEFGSPPRGDFPAELLVDALEEVLPAEYPSGGDWTNQEPSQWGPAARKMAEVAKNGGAVVTNKPLSVAQKLVATFKQYGINKVGIKKGLNEFAPGNGNGESGRWYTDDQMTDLVGDGWWNDLDVSGANIGVPDSEVPKAYMIQQAQRWLKRQGYSVQVLNCKANDDDMEWYIEGAFPKGLTEFAADDGDSGGEDDALHKYARMWWAGDEATQMQIEKILARMGWEIGEDEGGYDNGGVFVVRAGDINGDSYESWSAEDLTESGLNEKSTSQAQFRTMAAAAHNPEFARKVGIKQSVAREFNRADRGQDYKDLPKKADESKTAPAEKEADYGDDYQAMVQRVKRLAGLGPLKTVYDPQKRVYKNMPTAVQPKK